MFIGYTPRTAVMGGLMGPWQKGSQGESHMPSIFHKDKRYGYPRCSIFSMKELVNYPFKKTRVWGGFSIGFWLEMPGRFRHGSIGFAPASAVPPAGCVHRCSLENPREFLEMGDPREFCWTPKAMEGGRERERELGEHGEWSWHKYN